MKTIQTKPDCTLGFVRFGKDKPEAEPTVTLYGNSLEGWRKAKISNTEYEAINLLSEITEEQAKELMEVDKGHIGFGRICNYLYGLKESAKAVGILETDFDKYLVVKL
jgi:hypothetical protein